MFKKNERSLKKRLSTCGRLSTPSPTQHQKQSTINPTAAARKEKASPVLSFSASPIHHFLSFPIFPPILAFSCLATTHLLPSLSPTLSHFATHIPGKPRRLDKRKEDAHKRIKNNGRENHPSSPTPPTQSSNPHPPSHPYLRPLLALSLVQSSSKSNSPF